MGMQELPKITDDAKQMLIDYKWIGNVRQLENVAQRLLLAGEECINKNHVREALGPGLREKNKISEYFCEDNIKPLKEIEEEFKENYIRFVRNTCHTDAETAEKLGMAPSNFHRLCKKLGIK